MIAIGDLAPDFSVRIHTGERFCLSSRRGRSTVLLFLPRVFTPVCTREAMFFGAAWEEFVQLDAEVIGISPDAPEAQLAFAEKLGLPFALVPDFDRGLGALFGVGSLRSERSQGVTVVVGPDGVVSSVLAGEHPLQSHVDDALRSVRSAAFNPAPLATAPQASSSR